MDLRQRLPHRLARSIDKPLPLRLAFWDGGHFDFAACPAVTVTLETPRAARLMLKGDLDRLCDAYVSGEISVAAHV